MELEEKVGARSTFFFIPFKNRMGDKLTGKGAKMRAAKYDVTDIQDTIKKLVNNGFEAGVHGIDAWHDPAGARAEKARITEASGQSDVGIRMHWLYYNQDTHRILEEAGYTYDTTFGYNDAVGYRAGTTQIFKPISVNNILELPLNIQDTALFNPRHMSLTKAAAWHLVDDLISKTMVHGGVLTVLWHDRSLSPERLYEDFYIKLLDELKSKNVWFATAIDVCNWFKVRRATRFENVTQNGNVLHIKISNEKNDYLPSMMLRVYQPNINKHTINYTDLPWQNQTDFSINV
jgi:peptidoglycan/xylan/chitin deacetylase (PgdA/CDA1 family)